MREVNIYGFLLLLSVFLGASLGTIDSVIRFNVCKQLYPSDHNSYINCFELKTNKVYEKIKPIETKGR